MNYGQNGRDLLLELKRSDGLPAYNDMLVADTLQDLRLHVQKLQELASIWEEKQEMENIRPSILLQNAAIVRNKRCLLAYHVERVRRLTALYWENDKAGTLCPAEADFEANYTELVRKYASACGLEDLRAYSVPPTASDKVQVRVLVGQDGPIVLESGSTVVLTQGSTHYLLYSDVEEFIRDGKLRLMDGEEEA